MHLSRHHLLEAHPGDLCLTQSLPPYTNNTPTIPCSLTRINFHQSAVKASRQMKFPPVLSSPKCLQVIFSFQVVFPLATWSKGQSSPSFRREQKSLINTFELLVNGSISSLKKKTKNNVKRY